MSSYRGAYVKCPFYLDDTRNSIICEGAFQSTRCTTGSQNHGRITKILEEFCCDDFERCPLYRAVESKYKKSQP